MLVCYQQEIFFVHFRFFLTYKCETLNIRNICPQGKFAKKEKQKLKVKNTKNKFLIIFKFSSREKKKILTGRKNVLTVYWKVWNESWVTHSSRFFWKFMGRMRAVGLCTFLWICVCLGRERKRFYQGFYKNVHLQKRTFQKRTFQKRTLTKTQIWKKCTFKRCTFQKCTL